MKNRWLIVGCVWLVAFGLTCWNFAKVNAVAAAREKNERIRREMLFQRRHAEKLGRIEKVHAGLFLNVESVNLGLIAVRSDLLALAAAFGLQEAQLTSETAQATDEQIPVSLRVQGSFLKTVEFMAVLEKFPYLQITHTLFKVMPEKGDTEAEIRFTFRYRIKPPVQTIGVSTRMTSYQSAPGDRLI